MTTSKKKGTTKLMMVIGNICIGLAIGLVIVCVVLLNLLGRLSDRLDDAEKKLMARDYSQYQDYQQVSARNEQETEEPEAETQYVEPDPYEQESVDREELSQYVETQIGRLL